MNIRFGYIGNSKLLKDCSVNKTVSVLSLNKELDNEKKLKKLMKVARSNIQNTLKILENNKALGIKVYGMSPKLFPLANYPELEYFRYIDFLKSELVSVGNYIKENEMRVNIHLENTIIINSMSDKVMQDAVKEVNYQNTLLNYMQLDDKYKIIANIEGMHMNKNEATDRLHNTLLNLDEGVRKRIVLKNDGKTITTEKMLKLCDEFAIPFFVNLDNGVSDDIVIKSKKSWESTNISALFGLKADSGLVKLNGISDADIVFEGVSSELNILKICKSNWQ